MNDRLLKMYRFVFLWGAIFEPIWGFYLKYYIQQEYMFKELLWDRFIYSFICIIGFYLTYKKNLFSKYIIHFITFACFVFLFQQTYILWLNKENPIYLLSSFASICFILLWIPTIRANLIFLFLLLCVSLLFDQFNYVFTFNIITFATLFTLVKIVFLKLIDHLEKTQETIKEQTVNATMGRLAIGVSHQLNNKMAIVMTLGQLVKSKVKDDELKGFLTQIESEIMSSAHIIQTMKKISDKDQIDKLRMNFKEFIENELTHMKYQAEKKDGISFNIEFLNDVDFNIMGNSLALREIVLNIVTNATKVVLKNQYDKLIKIEIFNQDGFIFTRFRNNGEKIPEHVKKHLFDDYVNVLSNGKGNGLSLSYSKAIAESLGGKLYIDENDKDMTSFVLKLPITDKKSI